MRDIKSVYIFHFKSQHQREEKGHGYFQSAYIFLLSNFSFNFYPQRLFPQLLQIKQPS